MFEEGLLASFKILPYTCATIDAHAAPIWLHLLHMTTLQQVFLLYTCSKCVTVRLNSNGGIKEHTKEGVDWGDNSVVSLRGLQKKDEMSF